MTAHVLDVIFIKSRALFLKVFDSEKKASHERSACHAAVRKQKLLVLLFDGKVWHVCGHDRRGISDQ